MTLSAPLTYLATDAVDEGVGASQVVAYVERLAARGVDVELHTFEKRAASPRTQARLRDAGVRWVPHRFGRFGAVGGVDRLVRGAAAVRGAALVHARADLAAASVLLARTPRWVFDVRGLFADQRLELGTLRAGSPEHRVLQRVERAAVRRSTRLVTLTEAVVPVLEERHGPGVAERAVVVPTCVDTTRFAPAPLPPADRLRFLLAGTVNRYYDVPVMAALVRAAAARRPVELVLASPGATSWEPELAALDPVRTSATPAEMPEVVASAHVGLSVCREDAGISLKGSMPTKIAEFLATGRPVVVNPGLGDAGALVVEHGAGVTLAGSGPTEVAGALDDLEALLADPATADRCRALALQHFDLDTAVDRLLDTYRRCLG
jgi:glycosyltransferase involved in cell wall biosynthesis